MSSTKPTKKRRSPGVRPVQSPTCTLTQKIIDDFVAILRRGNFRHVARQRLSISTSTYDKWIKAGRKQIREVESGKRPKLLLQGKLILALDAAEGFVHGQMIEDILESGSIPARQWYLERRFNKLYSRHPNAHIDDETGQQYKIDATEMLAEKIKTLLEDDS